MSQTLRERRALSQRTLRAGDLRRSAHESDVESMASMGMLGGALLALAFVGLCAVVAVALADYLSDGAFSGAPVPMAIPRSVA